MFSCSGEASGKIRSVKASENVSDGDRGRSEGVRGGGDEEEEGSIASKHL